jgi:hypothetical protein
MSGAPGDVPSADERPPFKLWDHIGVISGVVLGSIVFAFLVLLAFLGDQAALAIVVVIVAGIALIGLGGKLHGLPRSR